jgi:hypothetical protein
MPYNLQNNKLPAEKGLQPIKVDVFTSKLGQRAVQLPTNIPEVNVSPRLYSSARGYQRLFSNRLQRQQTRQTQTIKPIQQGVQKPTQQPTPQPITTPVTPQNIPSPENNLPAPVKQEVKTKEIKPNELI